MANQDIWSQAGFAVRFGWGLTGASRLPSPDGAVVVVDVLSFTTAVDVCLSRGIAVYPCEWHADSARDLAREMNADLAVGREEVTTQQPWSLSPAHLLSAPAPARLVLPSPNGSAICSAAAGTVIAASLRNVARVTSRLAEFRREGRSVTVIAAGEHWPDGSLRPALEDLLGAAAVLNGLAALTSRANWAPDAIAAARLYDADTVADEVRSCGSARELQERGFGADVEVAVEVDTSTVVPVLTDRGLFADHASRENLPRSSK